MNIIFLGDIVGRVGRNAVKEQLPSLKLRYNADFVIANGENATHGKGLSIKNYRELISYGIDCITMGNHYLRVSEVITCNEQYPNMVRPYNMNKAIPGVGTRLFTKNNKTIRVTNLMGRTFMQGFDTNPFDDLNDIINSTYQDIHIVDFHAETTGEKMCLAYAFDGKVTGVFGTHTHVQTNDERILKNGTAFISDAGMCGLHDSILGVLPKGVITKTWTNLPSKFEIPESGNYQLNGVFIQIDDITNKPIKIEKINIIEQ